MRSSKQGGGGEAAPTSSVTSLCTRGSVRRFHLGRAHPALHSSRSHIQGNKMTWLVLDASVSNPRKYDKKNTSNQNGAYSVLDVRKMPRILEMSLIEVGADPPLGPGAW